jgi:hypothetical protein
VGLEKGGVTKLVTAILEAVVSGLILTHLEKEFDIIPIIPDLFLLVYG